MKTERPQGLVGRSLRVVLMLALASGVAACSGKGKGGKDKKRPPPLVVVAPPAPHLFREEIQAVGTARANEQVTMAANVTERIERLLFNDGMYVRTGQLLAVLSNQQERAALAGAEASAAEAAAQLQRINSLSEQGFATRSLLDKQRAALSEARASAAGAQAQINDRLIRAPFSGVLSLRSISEGAIVTSGTPLVTISDISRIKLDFTIPETQLAALRPGLPIRAFASAYPDQPIEGRISVIDPVIDPQSRAVMIRAILPNPGGRIKPGMLLSVRIETGNRNALSVPETALLSEGDNRYVFTVDKESKAVRTAVTTGLRDNGVVEVKGLPGNARVVTEGVIKVADGRPVSIAGKGGKGKGKGGSAADDAS